MKHSVKLGCLVIMASTILSATGYAQKETFDLVNFIPPKGWKKEVKETLVSYTMINQKKQTWCQFSIVKSTISKGSINEDFTSEWQELIVNNYHPADTAQMMEVQESSGWKMRTGSTKFMFNNAVATALLTTMSGYERCVSIVVITNTSDYLADVEAVFTSVDLKAPTNVTTPEITPPTIENNSQTPSIYSTWGSTASENSTYRIQNGVMNYIKRQYTFKEDGTYSFISKTYDPFMTNMFLGKESGSFEVKGNMLTVIPKKSVLESWSRNNGDKWVKKLNSQNIALEKAIYQFTWHYFSGIEKWNLVLQRDPATKRDGPNTNSTEYNNAWFLSPISPANPVIEMPEGETISKVENKIKPPVVNQPVSKGFAFTTTNFDDGWTSTVQENWVQVSKGNLKVLIHYPNKDADAYQSQLIDGLKTAWNVLVAPKYNSFTNLEFKPIFNWESIEYAEAIGQEKSTGQSVHVVLFKKNYSGGKGKYIEFISPAKSQFEQEFGAYHTSSSGWDKMENMGNRNKFAVAASDLQGKWTSNFSGMTQYVNAITGLDAGATSHASAENYQFGSGNTYKWDLAVASGPVGQAKFQSVKSSGKFSMSGNWQVKFSDIEGKPRIYDVHFSCIKGNRILWINDNAFAKVEK